MFIGEMLVEQGALTAGQLEAAHGALAAKGGTLVEWLVSSQVMEEKQLWRAVAAAMGLEHLEAVGGHVGFVPEFFKLLERHLLVDDIVFD